MTKYSKYINTFFFAIAILSTYNFMSSYDAAGRYQYRDFEFGVVYRAIASVLLLISLFYLLLQEWSTSPNKRLSTIASIMYIIIIMVDMNVWLWMAQWTWVYYEIILIHTLLILIIFSKFKIHIKPKHLFFIGLAVLFIGFLYDCIFLGIPYPDMTDEIFDKNLILEKTRNVIYYFGIVTIAFGIITLVKQIKLKKSM